MATLGKNQLNWYRTALSEQGQNAAYYVLDMIQNDTDFIKYVKNGNTDLIASIREKTKSYIKQAVDVFGDNAKAISNELFDYIMGLGGKDFVDAAQFFEDTIDWNMVDEKVRYYMNDLIKMDYTQHGARLKFLDNVGVYSDYLTKRCAQSNTWKNCDYYDIRYAVVPTGNETCAFCWMLASRGFEYTKSALNKGGRVRYDHSKGRLRGGMSWNKSRDKDFSGYHIHCDCQMIPEGSTKLDVYGYDPEKLQEIYYGDEYQDIRQEIKLTADAEGKRMTSEQLELKTIKTLAEQKGWDYMYGK